MLRKPPLAGKEPQEKTLRGWKSRVRSFWLTAHLTIALTVGLFLVVLGLTGAVNVFMYELEELGLPAVRHEADAPLCALDQIMQTVKIAYPDKPGRWSLLLPGYGSGYVWVEYPKPEETAGELYAPLRVVVDPYSGEIVTANYWGQTPWTLIYELHADLLAGKLGPKIGRMAVDMVCFFGLFLVISALTGLYLWWPKWGKLKTAVTIKRDASPERFYFDVHKTTGFYSALVLLIVGFTGFSFSYADYLKPLIRSLSPVGERHLQEPKVKSAVINTTPPLSIAQAVAIADTVFPDAELREIVTPANAEGVYRIAKRQAGEANRRWPRSKVWIDQYSGKVLAVQDPNRFSAGETLLNVLWPLHNAQALGLPGRIVWCAAGFAPLLLYVSGIVRWRQKRLVAQAKRQKSRSGYGETERAVFKNR